MTFIELFLLAVGLSMDAFAVSICKGLAMKRATIGKSAIVGLWFGGFQAGMPLLGYLLGSQFSEYISAFSSWVAFVLLALIGGNMIKESFSKDEDNADDSLTFKAMLALAVATSIDALAVGITFAALSVNVLTAVLLIGVTTFILSAVGIKVGNAFGGKYKSRAELAGGIILILLGVKILLEHYGVIA